MWYVLQIGVALYVAYFWTTMPGHTPSEFGHGLFLGVLVAWYATMVIGGLIDVIRRRVLKPAKPSLGLIRQQLRYGRCHQNPGDDRGIRTAVNTGSPPLVL